jgi:DNA polymerase-3 subunit delta
VGTNLREVAAACAQLASDSQQEGESQRRIDESDIMRYYGGRAEVRTFDVADRVVAGHTAEALGLFRHARDSGAPIVLFPAALARTLRQLAIVASAPRAATVDQLAAAAEVPDWKVKQVRENARQWTEAGLVRAIRAVAEADAAVKGGEADADYALERMLITVGRSRGRG